jgi:hypothetical protein
MQKVKTIKEVRALLKSGYEAFSSIRMWIRRDTLPESHWRVYGDTYHDRNVPVFRFKQVTKEPTKIQVCYRRPRPMIFRTIPIKDLLFSQGAQYIAEGSE